MGELWRTHKIGDRVRIVAWPPELHEERMHKDTAEFYRWAIETRAVLTIERIDNWGLPYGRVERTLGGELVIESVALNRGAIEVLNVGP